MPRVGAAPRADLAAQVSVSSAGAVPIMEPTGRIRTGLERWLEPHPLRHFGVQLTGWHVGKLARGRCFRRMG